MPIITRLIVAALSTAASILVTRYVTKLLEEKPDPNTKVMNVQLSALERAMMYPLKK